MFPDRTLIVAAAAATLIISPVAGAAQAKLPPYPEALRCAALTHAALQIGKGTKEEGVLFDHVIFWSMASADAGRAAGKKAKEVDAEVEGASAAIQPKLRAQDGATVADLAGCVARVPPLDK
ncbi:hypothetical protein [Sphingomonas sp.]|uniref:hypothetical protein n=1 Tax=Sphingomonas sp. TaxID=28214 RepID=UPI001EC74806|nr:hypothetical protein [Sphingomonas sp.]MBX3595170.1 hypothetical protein [Sphingomonas sp.]